MATLGHRRVTTEKWKVKDTAEELPSSQKKKEKQRDITVDNNMANYLS